MAGFREFEVWIKLSREDRAFFGDSEPSGDRLTAILKSSIAMVSQVTRRDSPAPDNVKSYSIVGFLALTAGLLVVWVVCGYFLTRETPKKGDEEAHREGHPDFVPGPIHRRPVRDPYPTISTLSSEEVSTQFFTATTGGRPSYESEAYELEALSPTMRAAALYSPPPESVTDSLRTGETRLSLDASVDTNPPTIDLQLSSFSQRPFEPENDGGGSNRGEQNPPLVIKAFKQRRWSPSGREMRPSSPLRPREARVVPSGIISSSKVLKESRTSSIRSRSYSPRRGRQMERDSSPVSTPRTPSPSPEASSHGFDFPFAAPRPQRRLSRSLSEYSLYRPASTIRDGSPAHGRLRRRLHSPFPTLARGDARGDSQESVASYLNDEAMNQEERPLTPVRRGRVPSGIRVIQPPSPRAEAHRPSSSIELEREFGNATDMHETPFRSLLRRSTSHVRDLHLDVSDDLRPTSSFYDSSPDHSRSRDVQREFPLITPPRSRPSPLRSLRPENSMAQSSGWETDSVPSQYPSIRGQFSEDPSGSSRATDRQIGWARGERFGRK